MNYDYKKIGERIRQERKAQKNSKGKSMTQEDIAAKYHVKRSTVSKWESGETMPSFQTMLNMCKDFDCELGYLLCEDGYENKTRKATDICEATGLSEEAVNMLQNKAKLLQYTNELAKIYGCPSKMHTYTTSFISYILENGSNLFETLNEIMIHESLIVQIKRLPYYALIKEAFNEVQEKEIHAAVNDENSILYMKAKEDCFYALLENKLNEYFSKEAQQRDEEFKDLFNHLTVIGDSRKGSFMTRVVPSGNTSEDTFDMLYFVYGVYGVLEMEQKKKYFKYELSDIFMDIVKAYVKEGVKNGGKD